MLAGQNDFVPLDQSRSLGVESAVWRATYRYRYLLTLTVTGVAVEI